MINNGWDLLVSLPSLNHQNKFNSIDPYKQIPNQSKRKFFLFKYIEIYQEKHMTIFSTYQHNQIGYH